MSIKEDIERADILLESLLDGEISFQELQEDQSFPATLAEVTYYRIVQDQLKQETKRPVSARVPHKQTIIFIAEEQIDQSVQIL